MHEILTTTRDSLTDRAAELESLIAEGETRCQAIADEGNRQIKVITDKAAADIGSINAELEKHVTELAGVQHSIGTIDAIADATSIENERRLSAQATTVGVPLDLSSHLDKTRGQLLANGETYETAAAVEAMQRHQQQDDERQAESNSRPLEGSNSVIARFTEKKQP